MYIHYTCTVCMTYIKTCPSKNNIPWYTIHTCSVHINSEKIQSEPLASSLRLKNRTCTFAGRPRDHCIKFQFMILSQTSSTFLSVFVGNDSAFARRRSLWAHVSAAWLRRMTPSQTVLTEFVIALQTSGDSGGHDSCWGDAHRARTMGVLDTIREWRLYNDFYWIGSAQASVLQIRQRYTRCKNSASWSTGRKRAVFLSKCSLSCFILTKPLSYTWQTVNNISPRPAHETGIGNVLSFQETENMLR